MPSYGGSLALNVYYADSTLCDPIVDKTTGFPARDNDPKTGKMRPWPNPYILMVDRGECTLVQKVRNAQHFGAAGVVVADNTCLCSDEDCISKTSTMTCETQEPIMADDSSGSDISIPSFLMFKVDADAVKAELERNRPVLMKLSWNLPSPDNRVEYDLWTTPSDKVSQDFLRSFKDVAESLGDRAYFTPYMHIYDGVRSHCVGNSGENFCYNLCTNNGRYCATDPDDKGFSGADVVRESLRRLCIWSMYGAANGIGKEWWAYVQKFDKACGGSEYFADDSCIKDSYKNANVDGAAVERCMEDSGGTAKDQTNSKLDYELKAQEQRGVVVVPTAYVNSVAIRDNVNTKNIFAAICSGYAEESAPEACKSCNGCRDLIQCVKRGQCEAAETAHDGGSSSGLGGVSTGFFALSMLSMLVIFTSLGFCQYKIFRAEISKLQVPENHMHSEYRPLVEESENADNVAISESQNGHVQGEEA